MYWNYEFNQGGSRPPKAARGHAMYIDLKMLSVTKYIYFCYSARAMTQAQLCNSRGAGMDSILSANVRFDED